MFRGFPPLVYQQPQTILVSPKPAALGRTSSPDRLTSIQPALSCSYETFGCYIKALFPAAVTRLVAKSRLSGTLKGAGVGDTHTKVSLDT